MKKCSKCGGDGSQKKGREGFLVVRDKKTGRKDFYCYGCFKILFAEATKEEKGGDERG